MLILGCAVQCERKEEFIKVIMNLEVSVQQEIVESIKQVNDVCKNHHSNFLGILRSVLKTYTYFVNIYKCLTNASTDER